MNVYYPLGGRHFLLHWWTYNERGHVILAPSERAVAATIKRVAQKHTGLEIRDYAEVEIVAPPPSFDSLRAVFDRRERSLAFKQDVTWRLHETVRAGKPLPPPFTTCPASGEHYECTDCSEGIRIGISDEELFDRYAATWPFKSKYVHAADPHHVPSRARVAEENEPFSYAVAEFGHHSSGIVLEASVEMRHTDERRPVYLSDRVLFFYRHLKACNAAPMQADLDATSAKVEALRKKSEQKRREDHKREERERMDTLLAFFGGRP